MKLFSYVCSFSSLILLVFDFVLIIMYYPTSQNRRRENFDDDGGEKKGWRRQRWWFQMDGGRERKVRKGLDVKQNDWVSTETSVYFWWTLMMRKDEDDVFDVEKKEEISSFLTSTVGIQFFSS